MRIKKLEINNFRAFYGKHVIDLDKSCKNLLAYGENGSGKSSLFYALKYFFESSQENIDLKKLENIFIKESELDSSYIKLSFKQSKKPYKETSYDLKVNTKTSNQDFIMDANKIKGFLDYKKLLKTYLIPQDNVDLFDLLLNNIISNVTNSFTQNEFIKDWEELLALVSDMNQLSNKKSYKNKIRDVEELHSKIKNKLDFFNNGLLYLLKDDEINSIKTKVNRIIEYFNYNIKIDFKFIPISLSEELKSFENTSIILDVKFFDKEINKHHYFLNEARLTALAISIYFASLLSQPSLDKYKILVLDDVFIGLDMSNRIPLLKILKDMFSEYQIFITTYDRQWFEIIRQHTEDNDWKYIEIYSKKLDKNNFEIPVIYDKTDFITKSEEHLRNNDYKASAVYIRTAFEEIVKKYCDKKRLEVKYKIRQKELTSEDFWEAIKKYGSLTDDIKNKIDLHKSTVMNPFSHYNIESSEFKQELIDTIVSIRELKTELDL